jgi:putative heme iron utilization protein
MADSVKERLAENRRKGHEVPTTLQQRQGSAAFLDLSPEVPRLTHAERAKTLVFRQKSGLLSTLAHEDGSPFGSIVNLGVDSKGDVFFVASKLAEHTANLEKDPRASLLVSEEQGEGDKLAVQRVTVVGKLQRVEKTKELTEAFRARHPTAAYVLFDDFFAYKFTSVDRVRFIAGFGEMSWVRGPSFEAAKPDPVSADAASIKNAVAHMNADHADANLLMVNKFAKPPLPQQATSCSMLSIDRLGIDFLALTPDGRRMARVPFPKSLESSKEVKDAIISLTRSAKV